METDDEFAFVDMPEDILLTYRKGVIEPAKLDVLIRYWTRKNGKFAESTQQIGKSLGISAGRIPAYIVGFPVTVTLKRVGFICVHCGAGPILGSRTDYQRYGSKSSRRLDEDGFCQDCAFWFKPLAPEGGWVLGHLTRMQLVDLVRRYYAQENCEVLMQEYAINLNPIEFAKNINAKAAHGQCLHCGQGYTFDALSQVEYVEGSARREVTCGKCKHEAIVVIERTGTPEDKDYGLSYKIVEYADKGGFPCPCQQCVTVRSRDPVLRRKRIIEAFGAPNEMVASDKLSLRQIVCLLGMLWSRTSNDSPDIVLAPNIERMSLTPKDKMKWDLIRVLTRAQIIYVDAESSPLNAFKEDDIDTYYMDRVFFLPNVTLDGKTRAEPAQLLSTLTEGFSKGSWQDDWTEELLPLWNDIAVEECMAYMEERAAHYGMDLPNEEKLRQIFLKLLNDFSVSEIWYMISAAYMNAAAFLQSGSCKSLAHATNTVPSKIVSLSERPRSQIKNWSRIKDIPRCAVTEVLFDIMLGAEGDAGFNLSPGKAWGSLLDQHLAQNLSNARRNFIERHPLVSDEALRELAEEYGDSRIDALVEYAIEVREYLGGNC